MSTLEQHPWKTKLITSGCIATISEIMSQFVSRSKGKKFRLNFKRILHMIIWAVCFGTPMSSKFYTWLEKTILIKGPLGILVKLLIDQLLYAVWFYCLYLFVLKVLETKCAKQGL